MGELECWRTMCTIVKDAIERDYAVVFRAKLEDVYGARSGVPARGAAAERIERENRTTFMVCHRRAAPISYLKLISITSRSSSTTSQSHYHTLKRSSGDYQPQDTSKPLSSPPPFPKHRIHFPASSRVQLCSKAWFKRGLNSSSISSPGQN